MPKQPFKRLEADLGDHDDFDCLINPETVAHDRAAKKRIFLAAPLIGKDNRFRTYNPEHVFCAQDLPASSRGLHGGPSHKKRAQDDKSPSRYSFKIVNRPGNYQ